MDTQLNNNIDQGIMGINELAWEGEKVKLCLPGPDKSSDIYYHSLCAGDFSSGEKRFLSGQMCNIYSEVNRHIIYKNEYFSLRVLSYLFLQPVI